MIYKLYEHSVNNILFHFILKLKTGADERHFCLLGIIIEKNAYFSLKTALFVEKRQNKFAHDLK